MDNYELLPYCWKHKLFGSELKSASGDRIDVLDSGLRIRNEGPVFFNAKVTINGTLWVGNVVCLEKASDWYLNSFDRDKRYDNVVLVVCCTVDSQILNSNRIGVNTIDVTVPENVIQGYKALTSMRGLSHCYYNVRRNTSDLMRHAWFAALQTEFMEVQSENIKNDIYNMDSWDAVFMKHVFKAFGFGVNEDIMESVFMSIPMSFYMMHDDDLFQIEAMILGQAGLLELERIPEKYQKDALAEGYFSKLRNEWIYLTHKFAIKRPEEPYKWKPLGRGQHIKPHVLLSSLANLIYTKKVWLERLLTTEDAKDLYEQINSHCTPYWETHCEFGKFTHKSEKRLTYERKSRILMACHIPFLFTYGREKEKEQYCDLAFDLMEQMRAYNTEETLRFERFGIRLLTAGDSLAVCHMRRNYCDKRQCLRCRFGYEFLKSYRYENR